jgi:hypothetical protein
MRSAAALATALCAACGRIGFDVERLGDGPSPPPTPIALATGQGDLRQILVDGDFVYWAGPDAIKRIAKTGGSPETIATFSGWGFRMAAVAGYLYWVTRDTGLVARAPMVANSAAETIATNQGDVGGIASDGVTVYWNNYPTAGNLFAKPIGGASQTALLPAPVDKLTGMRLVAGALYYLVETGGLFRVPTAGGAPETIVADIGTFELAIDGDDVFLANATYNGILRASIGGKTAVPVAPADGPWGIVVDATHVYFANEGGGTIARAPRTGGAAEVLATADTPVGIAVDADTVYWTTRTGEVGAVAK